VKLFGAQRRRETAKPLQFLELKAIFDCGGNTRQRSAGVRHHEGNSLEPRKGDFLKFMMQSSHFFKINYCIVLFLWHVQQLYHFSKIQLSTTNLIRIWFFSPLKLQKGCRLDSRIYGRWHTAAFEKLNHWPLILFALITRWYGISKLPRNVVSTSKSLNQLYCSTKVSTGVFNESCAATPSKLPRQCCEWVSVPQSIPA